MGLADLKRLIDLHLKNFQPDLKTAIVSVRTWLQGTQNRGDIHSFSVRRSSSGNGTMVVDVQTTPTGFTHTLQFVEAAWLTSSTSMTPNPSIVSNPPPIKRPETTDDAYERAMKGL